MKPVPCFLAALLAINNFSTPAEAEESDPNAVIVTATRTAQTADQALAAVTVNAAFSLDLQDEVGSIEAGKRADLVLLRSARLLDLVRVGVSAVRTVVKDGRVVVRDGRLEPAAVRP